ncbi:MAG: GerMN domain-containing protein [Acidobacteriota bacterium]
MTKAGYLAGGALVAAVGVALGWVLMAGLGQALRTEAPPEVEPAEVAPGAAPPPGAAAGAAVPKIKATLFFASEDGRQLVAVEREVPYGQDVVAQARAIVEAQLAEAAPAPFASAVPAGSRLRGLFVSARREAFVDLDGGVRAAHTGGSRHELLTVYAIVNAITMNLPDVQQVQILVDGREVDTLAGHVDLRRPLRKNEELLAPRSEAPGP